MRAGCFAMTSQARSLKARTAASTSWVDQEKKYLILPAAVAKNKRTRLVPRVSKADELLAMLKELTPKSPYVPGPNGPPLNKIEETTNKILESAGIDNARRHDMRRVVNTNMAGLGIAPHVADMILNHSIKGAPRSRAHCDMTTTFRRSGRR
jgi:hypothetical protein